jgi:hypothetical protein
LSLQPLNAVENYSGVYIQVQDIENVYNNFLNNVSIHPNGPLEIKPWGQKKFSILDPDHNLDFRAKFVANGQS